MSLRIINFLQSVDSHVFSILAVGLVSQGLEVKEETLVGRDIESKSIAPINSSL